MNDLEDVRFILSTVLNPKGFNYTESVTDDGIVSFNINLGIVSYFLVKYYNEHDLLYILDYITYSDCSIFEFSSLTDEAWHFQQMTVNKYITFTSDEATLLMNKITDLLNGLDK